MTPPSFISIDPGLAKTGGSGWAGFVNSKLTLAGVVRNRKEWVTIPQRVRGQFDEFAYLAGDTPTVCESMVQRYGAGAGKIPPQDLIDLNLLAGALGDCWVSPTEWKGGVPREMEQARTKFHLTPEELAVVEAALKGLPKGVHKEVWSAVGIGLSVAKRAHKKVGWPL
jgi:hypothetical protein